MASVTQRARGAFGVGTIPPVFLGAIVLAPVALGIGRLLPAEGAGLGLRLAAAAACIVLLPGALVLRAIDWPRRLGVAIAGSFAWSLAVVFLALLLMFAGNGSISLAVAVVGIVSVGALVAAVRAGPGAIGRRELLPVLGVVAAGFVLCGVVWWASTVVNGDALFHLARVRKLDAFPVVSSPSIVNEFHDGSLHPGYAFPLWHGVLALVARVADVDPTLVVLHLSAILTPLALVLAYAAGAALFSSWAGGVAAAVAQAALIGFQRGGTGSFEFTALPASAARLLILPALLALVFAFVRGGGRVQLLSIGAAALALAIVHPTYAIFVLVPLCGFLVARVILSRDDRAGWRRIALGLVAIVIPTGLFFAWLFPVVSDAAGILPAAAERARGLAAYGASLETHGRWFSLSPDAIARGGAATVAALLAVPAAVFAGRRRWAAYVLGGTLAILILVLVPPFFTAVADLSSLSQARRLALFLPLPFALAGAAALAGRLGPWSVLPAGAIGVGLVLVYPGGDGGGRLGAVGPGWATWVALGGGALALAAGWFLRRTSPRPNRWAAIAAIVFAIPIAVAGFRDVQQDPPDRYALTPGLVHALNTDVPLRATVFSDLETSYRIGAFAPVYIAAAPPAHVANTSANEPYTRRRDVIRFFSRDKLSYVEKLRLLSLTYGAGWLVVDKTRRIPDVVRFLPPPVYEDDHFVLYRLARTDA